MTNISQVKQSLLFANLPDGTSYTLAVLDDDRLAVLRNGMVVETAQSGAEGVNFAVDRFVAYTENPQRSDMRE